MATFFGEVLPVTSRAVDEDDDEEEPLPIQCSTVLRWSSTARADIYTKPKGIVPQANVIVSIGSAATGFTEAYIMGKNDTELLGVMCCGMKDKQVNTLSQHTFTDHTCYIYRFKAQKNVVLVQCKSTVPPEQYFSWTEVLFKDVWKLFENEDPGRSYVTILTSGLVSEYKTDDTQDDLNPPFLRELRSDNYSGSQVCPYLETPNTVSGLAAQVLSYCQAQGTKAALYMCYTEAGCGADSNAMKAFSPITQAYSLRDHIKVNPFAEKDAVKLARTLEQYNTLYI